MYSKLTTIYASKGSYAEKWATEKGYNVLLKEESVTNITQVPIEVTEAEVYDYLYENNGDGTIAIIAFVE